LTRVQTRIETIEIALHGTFFAVLTFARYVNGTVSVGVVSKTPPISVVKTAILAKLFMDPINIFYGRAGQFPLFSLG
jgi:hypothetical protein